MENVKEAVLKDLLIKNLQKFITELESAPVDVYTSLLKSPAGYAYVNDVEVMFNESGQTKPHIYAVGVVSMNGE